MNVRTMQRPWFYGVLLLIVGSLLFSACSSAESPSPPVESEPIAAAQVEAEPTVADAAPAEPIEAEIASPEPVPAETPIVVDDVTTDTATEPESVPEESSDLEPLFDLFDRPSETNGDEFILQGMVVDVNGSPVAGAIVEIWQTDANGVYDHPQDPSTDDRDTTFQFFGSAAADEVGEFRFRTLIPGRYEPRPRHIHFKVKVNGQTLLTSQFYFSDDILEVEDEGMFQAVGDSGDALLLQLVEIDGRIYAYPNVVVDIGIGSGQLELTPSQGEGPYYPVVNVAEYDQDLLILD